MDDVVIEIPHPQEWPVYTPEEQRKCAALIAQGKTFDYGYGTELENAEQEFRQYYNSEYSLSFNSGTSALYAAFFALGLGRGDHVLVPDLTFATTVTPLLLTGATPILVGAEARTGNVDLDELETRITDRTKAVVVTHMWGHPVNYPRLLDICSRHCLRLVEDCSHAHGSHISNQKVGTAGDIAIFSVGGKKLISGGLGGMLLTSDRELYSRSCLLGHFQKRSQLSGISRHWSGLAETGLGANLRMSPIAATLVSSQMGRLDELVATRQRNLRRLINLIVDLPGLSPPEDDEGVDRGGWFGANVIYHEEVTGVPLGQVVSTAKELGMKIGRPNTSPLHLSRLFGAAEPIEGLWRQMPGLGEAMSADIDPKPSARTRKIWEQRLELPATFLHEDDSQVVDAYAEAFTVLWKKLRIARTCT